jgi:hypothetical protein
MRWWWSSDPQTPVPNPSDVAPDPLPTPSQPAAHPREIADRSAQTRSQNETVEQTLAQYLPVFSDSQGQPDGSEESKTARGNDRPHISRQTLSDSVYPETMSCREAFDTAMYCRGPGGQFINLYRYGEFRQCSEQWSQFWFCMRTRTKPAAVKRELIKDWYRQKEEAKYAERPSSEDIWERRTVRLEKAFDAAFDEVDEIPLEDTRHRRRQVAKAPDIARSESIQGSTASS